MTQVLKNMFSSRRGTKLIRHLARNGLLQSDSFVAAVNAIQVKFRHNDIKKSAQCKNAAFDVRAFSRVRGLKEDLNRYCIIALLLIPLSCVREEAFDIFLKKRAFG